ncbi:hypothetical protein M758_11G061200 [Ceratodon purpureus]|nr:hypothetical protein M758_11G061200 [Ceratodon purpureus]
MLQIFMTGFTVGYYRAIMLFRHCSPFVESRIITWIIRVNDKTHVPISGQTPSGSFMVGG